MLVCAIACFSASDVLAKQLASRLPAVEIAWFRYLSLALALLPFLGRRDIALRSARLSVQVARAIALVASTLFFILALRMLPVAEATALVFASPLFITILSAIVLKESVEKARWWIVIVGFGGVLVVMRPGSTAFQPAALLPIASSIAWAIAVIFTRKASGKDGVASTMVHSGFIGFTLLSVIVLPRFLVPTLAELLTAAAMCVVWCAAQWLTVAAYHRGDASTLAPITYSQLIWSSVLGYAVFGHIPDATSLAGIVVILCCGALAAYWSTRRNPDVPSTVREEEALR